MAVGKPAPGLALAPVGDVSCCVALRIASFAPVRGESGGMVGWLMGLIVGESEGASEWKAAVSERLKCVLVAPLNGRILCQEGSFGESIGWRDLWSCWWRAHAAVFTFGLVGGCVAVCFSMLTGSTCRPVFACGDLGERHWTRTTYVCRRRPSRLACITNPKDSLWLVSSTTTGWPFTCTAGV